MKRIAKILALGLVLFVGCTFTIPAATGTLESHAASKIKISKTKASMTKGKTMQLKVKGTKKKVKWSSSKKSVATVSKNGKVTAKKSGKATITAKVGKKKLKCKVTVYPDYRKTIVNVSLWSGIMQGDYVEWEFLNNGNYYFTRYYDTSNDDRTSMSGKFRVSGNKLYIGTNESATIKSATKKELVLKVGKDTFKFYPTHI